MTAAFRIYLAGAAFSAVGDAILYISLPIISAVDSPNPRNALAIIVTAGSVTRFLGPLLGWCVDAYGPRRVVNVATVARLTCLGGGIVAIMGGSGTLLIATVLAAVNGIAATAIAASGTSAIPRLVEATSRSKANALNAAVLMGLPIVGYAAGGLLVAETGSATPLLVAFAFGSVFLFAAPYLPARAEYDSLERPKRAAGLRNYPAVVWGLVSMGLFFNLLVNAINVRAPLHFLKTPLGAEGYGYFEAVLGLSVLCGLGLAVRINAARWGRLALLLAASAVLSGMLAVSFMGGSASWFLLACLFGASVGVSQVVGITLIQSSVAPHRLGVTMGIVLFANAVGMLFGSTTAGTGVPTSVLLPLGGGLLLACAVLTGGRLSRGYRSPRLVSRE